MLPVVYRVDHVADIEREEALFSFGGQFLADDQQRHHPADKTQ